LTESILDTGCLSDDDAAFIMQAHLMDGSDAGWDIIDAIGDAVAAGMPYVADDDDSDWGHAECGHCRSCMGE
jgi:hypothetical protein